MQVCTRYSRYIINIYHGYVRSLYQVFLQDSDNQQSSLGSCPILYISLYQSKTKTGWGKKLAKKAIKAIETFYLRSNPASLFCSVKLPSYITKMTKNRTCQYSKSDKVNSVISTITFGTFFSEKKSPSARDSMSSFVPLPQKRAILLLSFFCLQQYVPCFCIISLWHVSHCPYFFYQSMPLDIILSLVA